MVRVILALVSTLPLLCLAQWPQWGRRRGSPGPWPPSPFSPQPDEPADTCGGPWKFKTAVQVFHIVPADATAGVAEKNAADAKGDLDFIFGGLLRASGVKQYYDNGFVELVHVSVDKWGTYVKCNHAEDSNAYTCTGPLPFSKASVTTAGRESNPETRNVGWWYSFPAKGEGVHWEQLNKGNCSTVRITAKCVIDKIASAAGCKCSEAEASSCGQCVEDKLSVDQRVKIWNSAFAPGGCPHQHVPHSLSDSEMTQLDDVQKHLHTSVADENEQNSGCENEYAAFLKTFPEKRGSSEKYANFCSTLDRVTKHNSGNSASWSMGINQFSDWSDDEKAVLLGWDMRDNGKEFPAFEADTQKVVAASVDHRSKMPAVKNQQHCGSCWAFSAIDVVDFFGGSHSEEELIDCYEKSCGGNDPRAALQWLSGHGVASESAYGYTAGVGRSGHCRKFKSVASVSSVRAVTGASSIMAAVQHQVVSVAFGLSERGSPFMNYHSGVYDSQCGQGAGHAVAAVGYSSDYWIIRNSWGPGWGQHGYIYFKKGSNLCGIESHGTIAEVSEHSDNSIANELPPVVGKLVCELAQKGEQPAINEICQKVPLPDCQGLLQKVWDKLLQKCSPSAIIV